MPNPYPICAPYDADILILSLDRVADTLAAIASALAQTGISRRVIVVDQGSQPENLRKIENFCAGHADVTLVGLGQNLGVAGGRNHAAALGQGRVIIGLDNDAEFATARTAAAAVAALDADRGLAAIGLRILTHADGSDDLSSWGYPRALLARAGETFAAVTFVGAGHAIRRAAWDRLGGYDSALFFCWEEYEFCLRAIAQGWRIRYRGDIAVRHKVNPEARQLWSGQRWFYFTRNRLYIARKFGASWPAILARFAGYLLKGLRNGLLRPTLRALPAAMRMAAATPRHDLPAPARAYLRQHDTAHRGGWHTRLGREILAALPGSTLARPAQTRPTVLRPGAPQQVKDQRIVQQIAPP